MAIVKVTSENFEQIKASDKPVLIDFYADWCMPCRRLAPIIDQIAEECPEYVICKVNVDDEPALASQFGVSSIPTLVVIRNGEVVHQSSGARPKNQIIALLEG
jgi:thioredoxin 1